MKIDRNSKVKIHYSKMNALTMNRKISLKREIQNTENWIVRTSWNNKIK